MNGYGDFAFFYDDLTENVDYGQLCAYLCRLLQKNGAGQGILLDLACGTGTLSLLLSECGYDVIGADASESMLAQAQEKRCEQGQDVLFLCQNMQQLDLFGTVDACVCTLDGINHLLREEEVQTAFDKVSLFMNPGGVFIFDVNTVKKHRETLGNNTFVYDLDEVYCVWQNTLDEDTDTVEMNLDIFEFDGNAYQRCEDSVTERAYTDEVLKRMLCKAGFEVKNVFSFLTENEASSEDDKAVYVCVKRKDFCHEG